MYVVRITRAPVTGEFYSELLLTLVIIIWIFAVFFSIHNLVCLVNNAWKK